MLPGRRQSTGLGGSRVLLTGASGGIGHAVARELHARGASLVLTGRRSDALATLRDELGPRAEVVACDLAERGAVATLVEQVGRVDVVVANAGLPASGAYDSFTPTEIDRALDVNLRAPVQLARALAPAMVARGAGHLVFVASFSGKVATVGSSIYSAGKFGLRGFAFSLREDLRGTGVGVTTVFPGFISEAGMFADANVDLPPGVTLRGPEQVAAAVVRGIERGDAEIDVAPLAVRAGGWLAGPAPTLVAAINRVAGARRVSAELGRAQRHKR